MRENDKNFRSGAIVMHRKLGEADTSGFLCAPLCLRASVVSFQVLTCLNQVSI